MGVPPQTEKGTSVRPSFPAPGVNNKFLCLHTAEKAAYPWVHICMYVCKHWHVCCVYVCVRYKDMFVHVQASVEACVFS